MGVPQGLFDLMETPDMSLQEGGGKLCAPAELKNYVKIMRNWKIVPIFFGPREDLLSNIKLINIGSRITVYTQKIH